MVPRTACCKRRRKPNIEQMLIRKAPAIPSPERHRSSVGGKKLLDHVIKGCIRVSQEAAARLPWVCKPGTLKTQPLVIFWDQKTGIQAPQDTNCGVHGSRDIFQGGVQSSREGTSATWSNRRAGSSVWYPLTCTQSWGEMLCAGTDLGSSGICQQ